MNKLNSDMESIKRRIKDFLGDKLDFIVLFGSKATGDDSPTSDMDIGVHVSIPEKDIHSIFAELLSLFDYVDTSTSPKVDVTLLNLASLSLLFRVVRDGKVLFAKDEEIWSCFVEYVLNRYPDWNIYIKGYLRQSLGV